MTESDPGYGEQRAVADQEIPILTDLDTTYVVFELARTEVVNAFWEANPAMPSHTIDEVNKLLADVETLDRAKKIIESLIDPRGHENV
jgi:hypothetical protein